MQRYISEFKSHQIVKEFRVDYHKTDEHVPINIDIKLFNAPCSVVSIDYRDMMGQDIHDIAVKKYPLDTNGTESSVNLIFF